MNNCVYCNNSIKSIRRHLNNGYKYITYPKFFFLCGTGFDKENETAYKITNRGIIQDFISKLLPDANIVLSEKLWDDAFDENIDLLIFEEFLAEVSDVIILFVESPGTFCELGAFAHADALFSDKLIIIMDENYRDKRSFISNGPILKAKFDGSKVIYAQIQNGALLASKELREEIIALIETMKTKQTQINKRMVNDKENSVFINSFIVELIELLRIVQPISEKDLISLYKEIKGFNSFSLVDRTGHKFKREIEIQYIMKLLQSSGIIEEESHNNCSYIRLCNYQKAQSLMLKYSSRGLERERNKLICRKYHYGEYV